MAFIHDCLKRNEVRDGQAIVGMPTPMEESHVGYDSAIEPNRHVMFFQFKGPDYLEAGRGNQGGYYQA